MKIFVILLVVILGFLGFTHFIQTNESFTLIPKLSFTFLDTFITTDEVITRYNQQSVAERLHGDPQFENIVRVLKSKKFLIDKENKNTTDAGNNFIPPTPMDQNFEKTNYTGIGSVLLDGVKAEGKTIRFVAEFKYIHNQYSSSAFEVWVKTETGISSWLINFDDSYKNVVSGFATDQRLHIVCTITRIGMSTSACKLIKFLG